MPKKPPGEAGEPPPDTPPPAGKKPKPAKSEAAAVALRVEDVLRIRLDGAQFHDVVQYAAENGWAVHDRQIRTYIQRADALLVERQDRNRRRLIARHIAQRESLFARAVNAADLRTALAVADSLAKLQGLFTDPRDVKELARLAASQGARLVELEKRLEADRRHSEGVSPAGPPVGPAGSGDAGGAGGTA